VRSEKDPASLMLRARKMRNDPPSLHYGVTRERKEMSEE